MISNFCYIIAVVTPTLNYYTINIINMKGITYINPCCTYVQAGYNQMSKCSKFIPKLCTLHFYLCMCFLSRVFCKCIMFKKYTVIVCFSRTYCLTGLCCKCKYTTQVVLGEVQEQHMQACGTFGPNSWAGCIS